MAHADQQTHFATARPDGSMPASAALHAAARATWAESLYPSEPRVEPRERFNRLAALLRRGRVAGLLAACGVWAAVAGHLLFAPPTYESKAVMMVDTRRLSEISARYASDESSLGAFGGAKVANQAEILRLAPAIAETTAVRLLANLPPEDRALLPRFESASNKPAFLALWLQQHAVTVTSQAADDQADAIEIAAAAGSPGLSRTIADTYVATYVDLIRDGITRQRDAAMTFHRDRVIDAEAELSNIDDRLSAFYEETGTLAVSTEAEIAARHVSELRSGLDDANIEWSTHKATLESLESEMAAIDPSALSAQIASSAESEISAIQQRISDLEYQVGLYYNKTPSLRDDPTPSSQLVVLLGDLDAQRLRLEELSKQLVADVLASGGIDLARDETGRNYLMGLRQRMAEERIAVRAAEARRTAIQRRLNAFEASKRRYSAQAIPLAQLERERDATERRYASSVEALTEIQLHEPGDYVRIIASAETPRQPAGPRPALLIVFGLIVGVLVGGGVAYGSSRLDGRVHDEEEISSDGLPLDGVLPDITSLMRVGGRASSTVLIAGRHLHSSMIAVTAGLSPEAALYRKFATKLAATTPRGGVVMFTSAEMGAGKSVTAANTAASLALSGYRTLLIDADSYRLSQRGLLGLSDGCLFSIEAGAFPPQGGLETRDGALRLLYTASMYSARPVATEHLAVHQLNRLVEYYREHFDFIVIDTPPVMATSFTMAAGRLATRRLLVTRSGSTRIDLMRQACAEMDAAGSPVTGVVLVGVDAARSSQYRTAYDEIRGYHTRPGSI